MTVMFLRKAAAELWELFVYRVWGDDDVLVPLVLVAFFWAMVVTVALTWGP